MLYIYNITYIILYGRWDAAGVPDAAWNPRSFAAADLDGDGRVEFLERKAGRAHDY